jgi:peptidyl-prolyl cis-trans isomerase B (cyclophilin B)
MIFASFVALALAQGAAAAASDACLAPALASAEVTLSGDVRVSGTACPGQEVELYKTAPQPATLEAPAGGLQALERVGTAIAGDCGLFVVTLPPMTMDTQLVARATDPAGVAVDSAPGRLTLSPWPEAVIETAQGSVVVRLFSEAAPAHVKNFIETALARGFDGTLFHRVVPDELVQGGDPLSRDPKKALRYGSGGLGSLKAEFSDRCFSRGTVGAVRCPSNCDSAGAQFFVALKDHPELQGQYTALGEVVSGIEVLDRISHAGDAGPLPRIPMTVTVRQPPDVFRDAPGSRPRD